MNAILNLTNQVIQLYIWVIIASAVMSWLVAFNVVNARNHLAYALLQALHRLTEPALRPIRRLLPDLGGIDISPVILILGLIFLRSLLADLFATAVY